MLDELSFTRHCRSGEITKASWITGYRLWTSKQGVLNAAAVSVCLSVYTSVGVFCLSLLSVYISACLSARLCLSLSYPILAQHPHTSTAIKIHTYVHKRVKDNTKNEFSTASPAPFPLPPPHNHRDPVVHLGQIRTLQLRISQGL